ncbi:tRNA (N(6)-L-threonylcarbamoyladenosine(37)-C(2))-methylthiotransferase MtaB [Parvibaculum sp.]|uniref:tRNA (N(6)-L-threonylcarbamoyladenosine(37)-C(2))- methylthiotransferase MtaB n=1 Tax=Parvibaculum sp. TaxID=2024848 RepID=UPI00329830A6
MRGHAEKAGLDNAIVFNTCAVTAEAERQARQAIRKARRENPQARIIVTGCAAQVNPDSFAGMGEVDLVIGNDEKMRAQSWQPALALHTNEKVRVNDIMSVTETAGHLVQGLEGRARAFVQVQNGCDHRCTFCIIPYGRGPSRSVPAGEVVAQVRTLVENGYREVVLTGVDMTSYGGDLPGRPGLGSLARRILKLVPELERLRLSSIDSIEADDDLMRLIADEERLMPHLHLSLQAGDDMILKRMKRRHLRDDSIRFCEDVRKARPDIVFGADFITGFPTETDEMFENTMRLVDECGLTWLHVFPFSPRPGTPAAKMPQVARDVAKARADRLRAKGHAHVRAHLDEGIGATRAVLMETPTLGRTHQFTPVRVKEEARAGEIIPLRLAAHDGKSFEGLRAA